MDMFGYRDGDTAKIVGVQCKCKGPDEQATETELRTDFEKALNYTPHITEYFFTSTADDHGPLQTFAAKLTEEQRLKGRNIVVRAWGWGTLEDEMSAYPEVALVFDPNHSPTAEMQARRHEELVALQADTLAEVRAFRADLHRSSASDATSSEADPSEAALDAEIDRYRDRANTGKPRSSLDLLQALLNSLTDQNSGHIWFRVKANIAHCLLKLGEETAAAAMLEEAVAHAPDDPKAAANLVLAMMLRGQHREALDRALMELQKSPDNEALAGYAVQAAGYGGAPSVISRIPDRLRESEAVLKYNLLNLRSGGDQAWMDLARKGRTHDGKDEFYRRQAAEADIQEILEGSHNANWALSAEDRLALRQAADDLISLWNKAKTEEAPERPDILAICMNATLALSALGEKFEARDLIVDGLSISQGADDDLLVRVAAVALEAGDKQLAEQVFPKLGSEGAALLLKSQIAVRYGNWHYLAEIAGSTELDTVPASDRGLIKVITASAAIKKLAAKDPASASADLMALAREYEESGRASVIIAQVAEDLGLPDVAAAAYRSAISAINDASHRASRIMVAGYASQRHDHAAVIRLLEGFVDHGVDNDDLLQLATAFAYEFPPRSRAVEFFGALPNAIRNSQKYSLLEGVMQYHRGDLDSAAECFVRAREQAPHQIQPLLMHVQTLLRQKRKSDLPALVADLEPTALRGTAVDQVNLAQVLAVGGRVDDALQLGFETLDSNRNNSKVALKWLGLCLGHLRLLHELSDAPIGIGMWTRLTSDDGQVNEFLVVDGLGDPAEGKYGPTHSIAEAAIGHRVGDDFIVQDRLGRSVRWTVELVQHKYLRAYLELTENFNTRFPSEDGFFVIRTTNNDIEPFLHVMRRQSEHAQQALNNYTQGPLPISVIVELSGAGDVIRFADSLRLNGVPIEACDGTYHERVHAIGLVKEQRGKGVVLDTLTFWALVGIDGLSVLKKVFGNVLLARSTADEIQKLREYGQNIVDGSERGGTAYFRDGQFYFDEMTPEREQQIADSIAKREVAMEADCEVVPVHAPDNFDPRVLEHLHGGALDPIFVARERGMLLISDDKRFRQWAGSQNVQAVWLQAVFLYAKRNKHIDGAEYARLIAQLAVLNHSAITCNAYDILEIFKQATPETRYTVQAIAGTLGVPEAEINSHFEVAMDAIDIVWLRKSGIDGRYVVGQLLQNIARNRPHDRDQVLSLARVRMAQLPGGAEYFDRWKVGHFIVDEPRGGSPQADELSVTKSKVTRAGSRAKRSQQRSRKIRRRRAAG